MGKNRLSYSTRSANSWEECCLSGFKTSKDWLKKFQSRAVIHRAIRQEKSAISNKSRAEKIVYEFKDSSSKVFSFDETGFFWKKKYRRAHSLHGLVGCICDELRRI